MRHSPKRAAEHPMVFQFQATILEATVLKSRPIIAFVAATVPSRAKQFYSKILGLKLVSEDDYAIVFDAGGTMLRVAIVQQLQPASYTVLGWIVPDIGRAVADLAKRRVKFQRYSFLDQDDLGIWNSPSGARVAWFRDPDGNTLSLTEFEKPARPTLRPNRAAAKDKAKSKSAAPRPRTRAANSRPKR